MNWTLVTAPAAEPVSLTEAKTHLRVDISDDDTLIMGLLAAARETFEEMTGRSLITQTWRRSLDGWPVDGVIDLPRGAPLQSVSGVVYIDEDGNQATWASSNYIVDTDTEPGRLVLASSGDYPSVTLRPVNGVQVTYVAGYGDAASAVPERYKQAIKLLIGHWYENRESVVVGSISRELPLALESLVRLNKVHYAGR